MYGKSATWKMALAFGVMAIASALSVAATGPTVSSVVTLPDRSLLLAPALAQVFSTSANLPGPTIRIDPTQTFQTMDGFGASITDSSAALLYRLSPTQRTEVMASVFDPTIGIGMSFLRQPIGSSDFVNGAHYTYDDLADGQTDLAMSRFSIAHDEAQILPLLRQALTLNPSLKILATPWGQPAWMKENNVMFGGRLKSDPAIIRAYALYLLKFVQAYKTAGVPIYALTVQNEPQNRAPSGYPGTDMPVATQAAVISELGPMLRDAGFGTVKIISYDHNWKEHPDDVATAVKAGVDAEPNYPYDILRSPAAQWIAGTGYHCYAGEVSAQTALHNAFPNKDIWFTECSGFHGNNDSLSKYFADTLKWHAKNIGIGTTQNWAKAVLNWNLALDPQGGPSNGGCGNSTTGMCSGVLTIDGTNSVRNAEYYTLGHLSKFVKSGAVRIGSNDVGDVVNVAFRNLDNSIALFVVNSGDGAQTFNVSWNGMTISYSLAPGAIATLTWPADGSGGSGDVTPPTTPTGLTATGTSSSSTHLSWSSSTDNVGVTGYIVYRDGVQTATIGTTAFTDTGLPASTNFTYTVKARDAAGNLSLASGSLSVTTAPVDTTDRTPPSQPIGLSAVAVSPTSVDLRWSASTDNVGVDAYSIYRNGNVIASSASISFSDTRLSPSTTYMYAVQAKDAAGNLSPLSPELKFTTPNTGGVEIDPTKWYQVVNVNSNKCLDDADWRTTDGASLQQWDCASPAANNQMWQFRPTGGGYYQVVNRHATNLVWDVKGGASATGDGIQSQLWGYVGGSNQQWQPVKRDTGQYGFVVRHSGKCLDVRDVSTANGAGLQQWSCTAGQAQSFKLVQQP